MSDEEFWKLSTRYHRALTIKLQEADQKEIEKLTGGYVVYVSVTGDAVNRIEYHEGREAFWPLEGEDGWVDNPTGGRRSPVYYRENVGWIPDFIGGDH